MRRIKKKGENTKAHYIGNCRIKNFERRAGLEESERGRGEGGRLQMPARPREGLGAPLREKESEKKGRGGADCYPGTSLPDG